MIPPDTTEIVRALNLLIPAGQVTELRALEATTPEYRRPRTIFGYFDEPEKLAVAVKGIASAKGIYITPNPVTPSLLSRAKNRIKDAGKSDTTSDKDIASRQWLLVDCDAVRPAGISASEAEHRAAMDCALNIRADLAERGWPDPILADSGNGAHLLYRVNLPADDEGLIEKCLDALADQHGSAAVGVDRSVHNPARIWKLYGTWACKGDSTEERPHRIARIIESPPELNVVSRDLLNDLAAQAPSPAATPVPKPVNGHSPTGNSFAWLDSFLTRHAGRFPAMTGPEGYQGGRRWTFNPCPWNAEHRNDSAFLIQRADGVIQAGCRHNGCSKENWHTLRALVGDWPAAPVAPSPQPPLIAEIPSGDPLESYLKIQADSIAGKLDALSFPWPHLTRSSRALVPGTVTCFAGEGGSTKSLALMECMLYWNQCGYRPAIFELEDTVDFHLSRAQAQLCREAGFTESAWMKGEDLFSHDPTTLENMRATRHEYVRTCTEKSRESLTELRASIWASPKRQATLLELAVWVEERAKEGHQIIVVDPVSAAAVDEKSWIADNAFIVRVKTIACEYLTRVVLVVHPRKGAKGGSSLDDLAGGAAYGRLCHNVIWVEVYDKDEELMVRENWKYPPASLLPNRIMKVVKCRNGPGRGSRIAFDFDSKSLTFRELGIIER